jgi:hypothetical protein
MTPSFSQAKNFIDGTWVDAYSGFEGSELGAESGINGAIESYTRIKSVTIKLTREPDAWGDPRSAAANPD